MTSSDKVASGRVLALDYGSAHTGAAVSDPTGTIARPLADIRNAGSPAGLDTLVALVREHGIGRVIVGMPLSLSGEKGAQARETGVFIDSLRQVLSVPVEALDERFTSKIAGQRRAHARASVHSLAACCLLESYLHGPGGRGA